MTDSQSGKLSSRAAIVTGGTTGLGFAIASAFLAEGARVAICGRDPLALESACAELKKSAAESAQVIGLVCDVASQDQVNRFVEAVISEFGSVQVLVNNAGILGPMGKTEEIDAEEWRKTMEVNLYGTFYCCQATIPHFREQNHGKIVNLSGGGSTSPRPFFSAYAASKTAVVRLTENLSVELKEAGIDVNAVAPGALPTRMLDQVLSAGAGLVGESQFADAIRQRDKGQATPDRAAQLFVYLASEESNGITGRLISAPWDPWESFDSYREDLATSDIYTLRRIIPEDRGKQWK